MPTLWLEEPAQQTDYPRAILVMNGEAPWPDESVYDPTNELPSESQATFDLMLVSENDSDQAEELAISAMRAFKPRALAFDSCGSDNVQMVRTNYVVRNARIRSKNDLPTFVAKISYRIRWGTDY